VYRIVADDEVQDQVAALPDKLLPTYAQVLDLLELTPWSGEPYNDAKPDGSMRQVLFGPEGCGVVIYLILEDQRRVDLLLVYWLY
jgi:hypothetical protein